MALREAREETGIEGLRLHPTAPRPLDVDVHDIPAAGEPAHEHLDLRYLVVAPDGAPLSPQLEELHDLRWVGLGRRRRRWDRITASAGPWGRRGLSSDD